MIGSSDSSGGITMRTKTSVDGGERGERRRTSRRAPEAAEARRRANSNWRRAIGRAHSCGVGVSRASERVIDETTNVVVEAHASHDRAGGVNRRRVTIRHKIFLDFF